MKIGLVSPYYMHAYGGVQTLLSNLQEFLLQRGHQVVIIAPRSRDPQAWEKTPRGVVLLGNSVEINFKNPFHTTFPIAVATRQIVADFLSKESFDVLNIHEPWMPILPYQFLQEANCPVVGTTHARWPQSLFNKSLEKARRPYFRSVVQRLDFITAVSKVAAYNIPLQYSQTKARVIPNAINLSDYQKQIADKRKKDSQQPFILYLNRLERRKGPRLLIRAYHRYVQQTLSTPCKLVIAGSGPQLPTLQADVARLGLQSLVSFEGFVSEERKMELFANAHLYVSPAPHGESFGIVLLEAMAANLPIVAGNNEGYQCVLQDQGSQSLIHPRRYVEFAKALEKFCNNQELRQSWLAWSEKEILKYDYPLIVDQYEACFKEAAKT